MCVYCEYFGENWQCDLYLESIGGQPQPKLVSQVGPEGDSSPMHTSLHSHQLIAQLKHLSSSFWGAPESKNYGANMGPTWVLSAPDGLHVGPKNLGIKISWDYFLIMLYGVVSFNFSTVLVGKGYDIDISQLGSVIDWDKLSSFLIKPWCDHGGISLCISSLSVIDLYLSWSSQCIGHTLKLYPILTSAIAFLTKFSWRRWSVTAAK